MSDPEKHHHVPQFYLAGWAGDDGRVTVYSRQNGRVVASRRAPKHTAFEPRLYTIESLPPQDQQWVEREVMSRAVDGPAAHVLTRLVEGKLREFDSDDRSAWARFIMAQWLRSPEAVAGLRAKGRASVLHALEKNPEEYLAAKGDSPHQSLIEWVDANAPGLDEIVTMGRVLPKLVNDEGIGTVIINMNWQVLHLDNSKRDLLTSDRPVTRFEGLDSRECLIAVPIHPRKLFVASHYDRVFRRFDQTGIVTAMNTSTVQLAHKRVYATGAHHLRLVEKWLA